MLTPHPASRLALDISSEDGTALVQARGELDLATSEQLQAVLAKLGQEERGITLAMQEVTFMDSSGLSLLLRTTEEARRGRWEFRILEPSEAVRRVFEITQTAALLPLTPA